MGTQIAFLRHSQPEIVEGLSAHRWDLSHEGVLRSLRQAAQLAVWEPDRCLTSREPKAEQTACLIAEALRVPLEIRAGLEEQSRVTVPFYQNQQVFEHALAKLFEHPDRVVFGEESALDATSRYRSAVEAARAEFPDERLAVVSHGTVMSLYLAEQTGESASTLWRRWTTPCLAILDLDSHRLVRTVSWDGAVI